MPRLKSIWLEDDRQTMQNQTFEVFHNFTDLPVETKAHNHDFFEVLIFLGGDVEYIVEGRHYKLRSGDIVLTNHFEIHQAVILSCHKTMPYDRFVLWIHPQLGNYLQQVYGIDIMHCFDSSSERHYNLLRPSASVFTEITRLLDKLLNSVHTDISSKADKAQTTAPATVITPSIAILEHKT